MVHNDNLPLGNIAKLQICHSKQSTRRCDVVFSEDFLHLFLKINKKFVQFTKTDLAAVSFTILISPWNKARENIVITFFHEDTSES